jgi:hypothetical protein
VRLSSTEIAPATGCFRARRFVFALVIAGLFTLWSGNHHAIVFGA